MDVGVTGLAAATAAGVCEAHLLHLWIYGRIQDHRPGSGLGRW
ncbi:hypothetical protein ABZ916_36715 [Streptomyces sp. NPDC046853]